MKAEVFWYNVIELIILGRGYLSEEDLYFYIGAKSVFSNSVILLGYLKKLFYKIRLHAEGHIVT